MVRIIKDNTKGETVVKCPHCKSIFSYTFDDLWSFFGTLKVECPCCNYEDAVFKFEEMVEND